MNEGERIPGQRRQYRPLPIHGAIRIVIAIAALSVTSNPAEPRDRLISKISVLTIHVRDVSVHDRVLRLLTDALRLPVDYGPVMLGQRRYAAVYAGNMFLEPCGPYSNMRYPTNGFQALFYGLNCSSRLSAEALAAALKERRIQYEQVDPGNFHITDPAIAEYIYLAVSSARPDSAVRAKEESLRSAMAKSNRSELGLEYLKEVRLAYPDAAGLQAWRAFVQPSRVSEDGRWALDEHQSVRFVQGAVRGVRGVVFKVRSLGQARQRLVQSRLEGRSGRGEVELDPERTCGLSIILTDR
jgi:hypothetical protein